MTKNDWIGQKVKIILDCLKDVEGVVINTSDGYFEKPHILKIKEMNSEKTHWIGVKGVIRLKEEKEK